MCGGAVVMYADQLTGSMSRAIAETERRRQIQLDYNAQHNITPTPIIKRSSNAILSFLSISRKLNDQELERAYQLSEEIPLSEVPELITQLEEKMKQAAADLEFEKPPRFETRSRSCGKSCWGIGPGQNLSRDPHV